MKYLSKGFIKGVPARDLSDEEVKKYGRKRLLDSGLYEETRKPREKKQIDEPVTEQAEE